MSVEENGKVVPGGSEDGVSEPSARDSMMVRMSTKVNDSLAKLFFSVGSGVGKYPWLSVFLSILLAGGLASGLFCCFEQEEDPSKLFTPQGTRGLTDQSDVVEYWGNNNRFVSLVITTKNSPLGNVLDKDVLLASFGLVDSISKLQVDVEGRGKVGVLDLCIPVFGGPAPCFNSLLIAWGYNPFALQADQNIGKTLKDTFTPEQLDLLVGGLQFGEDGETPVSGKALRSTFLLLNNDTDPNPNDDIEEVDTSALEWEKALVELTQGESNEEWKKAIAVYPQTAFSFTEEVGGAIQGDVSIVSASYMIIILFMIFVIQLRCDRVFSTISVALAGVLTIGLGILSSFGLCQFLGFKYGNTHSILPFIVLGVGADGCFIIVNAFRRTNFEDSLPMRAGKALSHAGVSLSVSSLTNVAAFGIGSLTVIPDLSSFGKYAAFALLFLWFYLCTFYLGVLVINERRMAKNKLDMLCCFTDCRKAESIEQNRPTEFKPSFMSRKMRTVYTPIITNPVFRIVVLVLGIGYVGFCGYMITTLSVEATGSNFLPDGSYLKTNFDLQAQYFGGSPTDVQVVVKNFDYDKRGVMYTLPSKFRFPDTFQTEPPYIIPFFSYWMTEFTQDLAQYAQNTSAAPFPVNLAEIPEDSALSGARFPTKENFIKYLNLWLNTDGAFFRSDFRIEGASIERVRTRMQHYPIGSFDDEGVFKEDAGEIVDAMDKMYEICDKFAADNGVELYPYAFPYTEDWSSFKVIADELVQNVGLALLCVFVVVTLLIGHPGASMMVFISCAFTIVELLGTNALIGLSVDTVVTVCTVLAVGISVDYSAHIGYGFMLETGSRNDRIGKVLEDVGVPVVNGAISTFLAIALQSLSSSYVFRVVFYEFFFAILYSALNGIVLLPVALSLFGPAPYKATKAVHDMQL